MSNPTLTELLSSLHEELAKELLKRLQSKEGATTSDLNVIRQFLKDNGIDNVPTPSNAFGALVEGMPFDERDKLPN